FPNRPRGVWWECCFCPLPAIIAVSLCILTSMTKKIVIAYICLGTVLGVGGFLISLNKSQSQNDMPSQSNTPSVRQTDSKPAEFDKNMFALDEPGSPWWVVNKKRPLPDGYIPTDLAVPNVKLRLNPSAEQMQFSQSATPALDEMLSAAAAEGVTLVFGSGYRSEAYQRVLYNGYVAQDGQAAADRYSARPGTSEHQTGLTFDATAGNGACHLEKCFEDTPEGRWLAQNAYKYG